MLRNRATQVVPQLLEDVAERWWSRDATAHRETQAMGLVRPVVRVLAEDHDAHVAIRREVQRGEHVVVGWIHRALPALVGHELLQFLPVGLVEFGAQERIPVGRGHGVTVISRVMTTTSEWRDEAWHGVPRVRLATLPTPLERGPIVGNDVRLWVKRDDLTGLGMGGNKARKLEFLCGAARREGADALVTVGAGQSNHCRMTAAAGALLGWETHLVLAGHRPELLEGNQLLSDLFGAHLHFTGAGAAEWGVLEIERERLTAELNAGGRRPYSIPIGGSTEIGAVGYIAAYDELVEQCIEQRDLEPRAIVFTSSSGGTHAGLVAGRAWRRARGHVAPPVIAIGVAKGVVNDIPDVADLAQRALDYAGLPGRVEADDVEIDKRWMGEDYAVPTEASVAAAAWGATTGAWVLDGVYTAKGMAGLLGNVDRWSPGDHVVFIHTGGHPEVFVRHG